MGGRLWSWYGASPVHLAALLVGGALSAYAVTRVDSLEVLVQVGIWFVGTLLVHDLVLFPVYATADNVGAWVRRRRPGAGPRVPWVNHVRVPVFLSGLLLLAWFPLILRLSSGFERASNRATEPYLGRWLLVTGVLFAGSAALYLVRAVRARNDPGTERLGRSAA